MLEELKSCFMEAYDDNQDGKIDIRGELENISLLGWSKVNGFQRLKVKLMICWPNRNFSLKFDLLNLKSEAEILVARS